MSGCELDFFSSGWRPTAGCYEQRNEPCIIIQCDGLIAWLRNDLAYREGRYSIELDKNFTLIRSAYQSQYFGF